MTPRKIFFSNKLSTFKEKSHFSNLLGSFLINKNFAVQKYYDFMLLLLSTILTNCYIVLNIKNQAQPGSQTVYLDNLILLLIKLFYIIILNEP